VPDEKYGTLKFTCLARSSVMVKLASTRSTLPDTSNGTRLAGLVGTNCSFTPRRLANFFGVVHVQAHDLAGLGVDKAERGLPSKAATRSTPAFLMSCRRSAQTEPVVSSAAPAAAAVIHFLNCIKRTSFHGGKSGAGRTWSSHCGNAACRAEETNFALLI
jgi:hypothetical protein